MHAAVTQNFGAIYSRKFTTVYFATLQGTAAQQNGENVYSEELTPDISLSHPTKNIALSVAVVNRVKFTAKTPFDLVEAKMFVKFYISEKERTRVFQNVRYLSYFHLCGKHPFMYKSVGQLLDETAQKFGDRTAYVSVYQNQRITFLEANKKADALAAGILKMGIEKGDRVGLWAGNSLEWYITSFALAKAGIISVYLNPSYQALEIEHCLNAVGVKMLIMNETFKTQNYPEILSQIAPEIGKSGTGKLKCKNIPTLESVVCISEKDIPGMLPYKYVAECGSDDSRKKLKEIQKIISPDDACNIQFTSGTTGSPKGAVLSHFHIINNSHTVAKRQELHRKNHVLCFMGPLFHAMGSVIAVMTCLHEGVTLVIPERAFSPANAAMAVLNEKCTILLGTPTMYVDLIKICQEKGLKFETVDLAFSGGAYAPAQLVNDIYEKLGVKRFSSVYGLTETGPICFMSTPADDKEKVTATVGFIMDNTEAKVVDEKGFIVPWDTPGELWVRGYHVMKGYWGDESKTKQTITEDNWLKTGDQFAMTKDGYGKIVGRIKDMIIRGGENIFPAEVEEFLSAHPDLLDVQVVGVPDKRLGEQVCACIRVKPEVELTENLVKNFCKGKIADFKIPHYVYFIDDFPKTSSGKVQKYKLRMQAMEHFKLTEDK